MVPGVIGQEAAATALRILGGESPATIPTTVGASVRPIFDWRELRRWRVNTASLPPGSEIRFREPTAWDRYQWQLVAIIGIVLAQGGLIVALLYQHRRRRSAELEARQRMAELAHMNRQATVGQLSASLAHELNQPLGAILNNVEAAAIIMEAPSPDLQEIRAILHDIRRDDQRASDVIKRLRTFLARRAFEPQEVDINQVVRDVLDIASALAAVRGVKLSRKLAPQQLFVTSDRVQLQQVVLNLVLNSIQAFDTPGGAGEIVCSTWATDSQALMSIRDSGPGIPADRLERLFEPFFTTKEDGMGMGLCIARTIVETYSGKISAESRPSGAVFHVSLPLAKTRRR
jgi:C4-dicarboxylate-specific signal transduction histidine kinase